MSLTSSMARYVNGSEFMSCPFATGDRTEDDGKAGGCIECRSCGEPDIDGVRVGEADGEEFRTSMGPEWTGTGTRYKS